MNKTKRPTLTDQSARIEALETTGSFIVQAPAGSGKTHLLVSRYLALLSQVEQPENILAITFTRKAAFELKEKIINALTQTNSNSSHDPNLIRLAENAHKQNKKQGWLLEQNSQRLKIQTIDSFNSELVQRMPWSSRLGGMVTINESPYDLYLNAAHNTLSHIDSKDEWQKACHILLTLSGNWLNAQTLIADMLAKRDLWMALLNTPERAQLDLIWQQIIEQCINHLHRSITEDLHEELVFLFNFAIETLRVNNPSHPMANLSPLIKFPDANIEQLELFKHIAGWLTTNDNQWRKRIDKNTGFLPEHKSEKSRIQHLIQQLQAHPQILPALVQIKTLPQPKIHEHEWQQLAYLMSLLKLAVAELRLLFNQKNTADFIEISQRAEWALGDHETPTDLSLYFDYRLDHILIDEYQDTSQSQINLVQKLVQNWHEGDGRTLFFVGDPMQSIYRFRGADISHFLNSRNHGTGHVRLTPLRLTSNFRCRNALIDWFNQTFVQIFPRHEDELKGAVNYLPATYADNKDNNDPATVIHAMRIDSEITTIARDQFQSEKIATLVKQLTSDYPHNTIGILGRTRKHLAPISQALDTIGIAHESHDLKSLANQQEILDLVSLTCALLHNADQVAWLSLLRAPWCALSLKQLTQITDQQRDRTLYQTITDPDVLTPLNHDTQRQIQHTLEAIKPAYDFIGQYHLSEIIYSAWVRLGAPQMLTHTQKKNCESFFDLLDTLTTDRTIIDRATLEKALQNLWAPSHQSCPVQMMTIHKAKGLEFDFVIIPFLEKTGSMGERPLIRWQSIANQPVIAMLPDKETVNADSPSHYDYIGSIQKAQEENERIRLLYVACTRAKNTLHLFGIQEHDNAKGSLMPRRDSMLGLLWPMIEKDFEQTAPITTITTPQAHTTHEQRAIKRIKTPNTIKVTSIDSTSFQAQQHFRFNLEATQSSTIVGTIFHLLISAVDIIGWQNFKQQSTQHWQATITRQLARYDVNNAEQQDITDRTLSALTQCIHDPIADWLFDPKHDNIHSEWPIIDLDNNQQFFIDRSFVSDGIRWIIDFKTSTPHSETRSEFILTEHNHYKDQLEHYAKLVSNYTNEPIKCALYFPNIQRCFCWATADLNP